MGGPPQRSTAVTQMPSTGDMVMVMRKRMWPPGWRASLTRKMKRRCSITIAMTASSSPSRYLHAGWAGQNAAAAVRPAPHMSDTADICETSQILTGTKAGVGQEWNRACLPCCLFWGSTTAAWNVL